jgi:hypothetical protein
MHEGVKRSHPSPDRCSTIDSHCLTRRVPCSPISGLCIFLHHGALHTDASSGMAPREAHLKAKSIIFIAPAKFQLPCLFSCQTPALRSQFFFKILLLPTLKTVLQYH